MATLVFSALGTVLGGPLGGAIGALVGRQVDAAIIGGGHREGPRLKELTATTSSYGAPIPRHFGRMRVPGTIIWATDLVEHSDTEGGGKGRPSITTYTYTASFAVALASRPIAGIGRIWADGNLLRGEAGDLKTGGTMRLYKGWGDQPRDPLIAAAEGEERCPAWRGTAYVVFEDLELGDFFNRIPALTFEVIADEGAFTLRDVIGETIDGIDAEVALDGVSGLSCEGPLADTLRLLDPVFPMDCDAGGEALTIARERLQDGPPMLPEASVAVSDEEFGGGMGFTRRRGPAPADPPEILRYYDIDRDYQPGLQRAAGRPSPGQPRTIELPLALTATNARALAERTARGGLWRRETIAWRCARLDPAIAPGAIVTAPGQSGLWRVEAWEWRETGVELSLARVAPSGAEGAAGAPVDPGRLNPPADMPLPPTTLAAFELPWDGSGDTGAPAIHAALSSQAANWSGAALYADQGDGALVPLGPSGRTRSVIGTAEAALPPASPLLIDRASSVVIELIDPAMQLADATGRRLALGANRALLGEEILQFGRAMPLGAGRWRLETLLRGRGGTEWAIGCHAPGETFVLIDQRPLALDPRLVGDRPSTLIVAVGRGDAEAVTAPIALGGVWQQPLSPVHGRAEWQADGGCRLRWIRRARGAWQWLGGIETPLNEETEAYRLGYGPPDAPVAIWPLTTSEHLLPPETLAELSAILPGGAFHVRQVGRGALSRPLHLVTLP